MTPTLIPTSSTSPSTASPTSAPRSVHPYTNGFVERFQRTIKEDFFEVARRETFYESVDALQGDLDTWQVHYNTVRPHLSYCNIGKRLIDTVNAYLSVKLKA